MANDSELLSLYDLCDARGKFVYEVVPGYYPGSHLTAEEFEFWLCHGIINRAKVYEVQYHSLDVDEVIILIKEAERKRLSRYAKGNH